jgi:hypothetical protein
LKDSHHRSNAKAAFYCQSSPTVALLCKTFIYQFVISPLFVEAPAIVMRSRTTPATADKHLSCFLVQTEADFEGARCIPHQQFYDTQKKYPLWPNYADRISLFVDDRPVLKNRDITFRFYSKKAIPLKNCDPDQ